ncbi:MAG: glycosyl hydrolase [Bacteroidota bacterium]
MKRLFTFLVPVFITVISAAQEIVPTNEHDRLQGIAKSYDLKKKSLVNNVKFRNVGPTIMSGRAVDVCVNDNDPTEFYVAYASGGLWHTTNNGQSFTPLFDNEAVITIGAIAVDWKTHNIWVGTGESNSSRSSYSGTGLYFSSDSGRTWQHKGMVETQHIGKILIHPTQPNTLFFAAVGHLFSPNKYRGVFKTTDGGSAYKQVLYIDDKTGAIDIAFDPVNPQIMYAAMWHRERQPWNFIESGSTSGIYKSVDGGDTWNCVTKAGSGFPQGEGVGRIGLAVFPKNPEIVYAIMDNQDHKPDTAKSDTSVINAKDLKNISKEKFLALNDKKLEKFLRENDFPEKYSSSVVKELIKKDSIKPVDVIDYLNDANNSLFSSQVIGSEVYRSNDAGKSWKKMNKTDLFNLTYTYGYYFGRIVVSPTDENKIVVCGLPLLMSKDGGETFSSIDGANTHGDHHAVWINPKRDSHFIDCDDGGLHITYDDGKNWFKANTPPVGQFYSVNVDNAKPYNVYGGLQDNGVWWGSSLSDPDDKSWMQRGENDFKALYGGDGMQVQVDTRDNNTVYSGFQFGYYARIDKTTGRSKGIHPKNDLGEPNFRFKWQTPIWLSRHNQDILYMGTNRFMRSMNKGDDMKAISPDLTLSNKKGDVPFNTIVTICESPTRFGLIYSGTDDGLIWVSKDDGYTWQNISDNIYKTFSKVPPGLCVTRVTASAFSEGRLYACFNGHHFDHFNPYLFVSNDYGNTWNEIDGDLPFEPINVVKEDVVNENILFVGTDNGLYTSLDRGKSFMAMTGGLPRVAIHDMVIQPREKELVLGTHGRSIYIAKLNEIELLTDSVLQQPVHLFPVADVKIYSELGKKYNPFSETPNGVNIIFPYFLKQKGATIRIKSEKGLLLKTIKDSSEAGLNYQPYNLGIDSAVVKQFEKSMSDKKSKPFVIKQAEDKKYYLVPGKYKVEIVDAAGNVASGEFKVKGREDDEEGREETNGIEMESEREIK